MKKIALKTMILFSLIILVGSFQLSAVTPYLSPGITFGYSPNNERFSIVPKISLGFASMTNFHYYANITFGYNILGKKKKGSNSSKVALPSYYFLEVQAGTVGIGAGAGIAFVKQNGKTKKYPKYSLSVGLLAYYNVDCVSLKNQKGHFSYGVQGVVPIPLDTSELDFL